MMGFDQYSIAAETHRAMQIVAREEIKKARPAPRQAEVMSIIPEDRKALVRFIGEETEVLVPYNGTKPAVPGQYVRIAGTAHDRYIEDVIGTSDAESRIETAEEVLLNPGLISITIANDAVYGSSVSQMVLNTPRFLPVGTSITSDGAGLVTFTEDAYYDLTFETGASSGNSSDTEYTIRAWMQCLPIEGGAYDVRSARNSSGWQNNVTINTCWYFNAGDKLRVNISSDINRTFYKMDTELTISMKLRMPKVVPVA